METIFEELVLKFTKQENANLSNLSSYSLNWEHSYESDGYSACYSDSYDDEYYSDGYEDECFECLDL